MFVFFLLIPKAKSNTALAQIQVWDYFLMAWQADVSVGPDLYWSSDYFHLSVHSSDIH